MKILTCMFSLTLVSVLASEPPKPRDALSEALYTENVTRDREAAAAQYLKIIESFQADGSPAKQRAHAATALFRLAEIRSGQDNREDDARKHYEAYLESFSDLEPQAGIARRKLGIAEPEHAPTLTQLEERAELAKEIKRSRWKFSGKLEPDQLLLTTFKVEPMEGYANEGLPVGHEVETLHYAPSGQITKLLSRSWVIWPYEIRRKEQGDRWDRRNFVTGLGQSFAVPEGLSYTAGGDSTVGIKLRGKVTGDGGAQKYFIFEDQREKPTKRLWVQFKFDKIRLKRARKLLESRNIELPEMGKEAWSLTLPPSLPKLERAHDGE